MVPDGILTPNAGSDNVENAKKTLNTVLFSVVLLFFIQLWGMWIESIYRMSLMKLAPGRELWGVLLLLLPLAVAAVRERAEGVCLTVAMLTFVAARLTAPLFGTVGQIVVAGLGVSMFLVILAFAFSVRFNAIKGELGTALGLAVLASVAFRSWGASMDISVEGRTAAWGWILGGLALCLFFASMATKQDQEAGEPRPLGFRTVPAMLGLFANAALVYLLLSCPEVACAWTAHAQGDYAGVWVVTCTAVAFAVFLAAAQRTNPGPAAMSVWNLVLSGLLLGGLFAGRVMFPGEGGAPVVTEHGADTHAAAALCLALLVSPVVLFNVRHVAGLGCCARPRNAVLPIMLGMAFLFVLTLLLIFSNVWGYVPGGPALRNRFYLPFLLAAGGMLVPWAIRGPGPERTGASVGRILGAAAFILALLAVSGALVRLPRPQEVSPKRELTVLSYNMQQGSHLDGTRNYRGQLELLRRINPDIIGLQESDTARPSGGNVDAVRYFAASLGYHAYYGPGSVTGTFGAAILSRYPIAKAHTVFTFSDSDEVGTAVAEIRLGDQTLGFVSAHPSGGERVMNAFVESLKREAAVHKQVIAVGDYNFTAREPYFENLSQALQDSATLLGAEHMKRQGGTDDLPGEIDHIFVSRNIEVLESRYLQAPDSQTDHPAHWAVLRLSE